MPGIFGILNRSKNRPSENFSESMYHQLEHGAGWFGGKCLQHKSGFHGLVDFRSRLEGNYAFSSDRKSLVVYGEIYSSGDLKIFDGNKAKTLLSLYEKDGLDFLDYLNGSFALSIYDEEKGKATIATDRYGSKNLFYVVNSDTILFSSEIKGILKESSVEPKLNPEAIGEFFTFSYLLGNKTFFKGIELIPPASTLIYDFIENKIHVKTYWDFEFNLNKWPKNLEAYLEEFDHLMEVAVERRMADKEKLGVFLSGGLDSRLIVGFAKIVADRTNKELISYTFGSKGGWQQKIAMEVANKLEIENKFYEIPSDSIAKYAEEVVHKGDGHIRIRDAHFISLLDKLRTEIDTVLVGFFCDTVFGAHLWTGLLQFSNKSELINSLFNRFRIKQIAEHVSQIFAESFAESLEENVMKEFIKSVREIALSHYEDIAHYWDLRQRGRRYILPISSHIDWYLNARDPFLDNEVVNFAMNLPLELKFEKRFIHKALRYSFPVLAQIPQDNTGVPPDTRGLSLLFSRIKRFVEKQSKNLVQKTSFGKVLFKPKDYRGYDYWLRTGSKRYVENLLLRGNYQNVFNQKYVEKILKEHMTCRGNHDLLICDILNIGLLLSEIRKNP